MATENYKYLDFTGLGHFWEKIKTYVNDAVKVTGVKGNSESSYRTGNVNITKANIGLGNVENKTSATIRGELTKANVTTALGYTPPTTDTTYSSMTSAEATSGTVTDPRVISPYVLHAYVKDQAYEVVGGQIDEAIKTQSVTISSVAINNNAWADISGSMPTAPTSYTFLFAAFESWGTMTTKGPISVTVDGHYAMGPAGTTITNLKVKYFFIKSAML